MIAIIESNKIKVKYHSYGIHSFLELDVPNGWEDVRPLINKVLNYNGNDFVFTDWNSANNICYFNLSEKNIAIINKS